MPASTLFLISLQPTTSISTFIPFLLSANNPQPTLIARPRRWIIHPWISNESQLELSTLQALTSTTWDLLVIFPATVSLPRSLISVIQSTYTLQVGISSKIFANFADKNKALLHPTGPPPKLTGSLDKLNTASSSKNLELTPDLREWFSSSSSPNGAVSMLNLLTFHEGKLDSYKRYGSAFATDVGKRRGGLAKIVGTVLPAEDKVWDEIAVAHYPSLWHFADMLMGEDYQKVNAEHRIGALRGTTILCCDELDGEVRKGLENAAKQRAKI